MIKINGESLPIDGQTVADYLAAAGYKLTNIVVERNEEILPKKRYAETVLTDGDSLEIVCFMGGG